METHSETALIALRQILRATEMNSRALAKAANLSPSQLILLQVLSRSDGMTPGAIAKRLSISQATVTAMIDKLSGRGLVERQRDNADKRRVIIRITGDGEATMATAPDQLQEHFVKRFEALPEWERSFLIAALQRTASLLDAEEIDAAPVLDIGGITSPTT